MSSSIRLSLEGDEGIPLVARVFPNETVGSLPVEVHEVVVPTVGQVSVEVPPGSYVVSLLLPTGLTLREACDVEAGRDSEVAFDARGKLSSGLERGDTFSLQGALSELHGEDLAELGRVVVAQSPASQAESAENTRVVFKPKRAAYGRGGRDDAASFSGGNRGPRDSDAAALALIDGSHFQDAGGWTSFANVTAVRRLGTLASIRALRTATATVAALDGLPDGCSRGWVTA